MRGRRVWGEEERASKKCEKNKERGGVGGGGSKMARKGRQKECGQVK